MKVTVLYGGPSAEREVSLVSGKAVAAGLKEAGHDVTEIDVRPETLDAALAKPADVVFPVLHGGYGEGGPLQDMLEADGRPFVFSRAAASRLAMDKIATKMAALSIGIPTPAAHILDPRDPVCPLPFPVIIKPVHEGSTVGLHVVRDRDQWEVAMRAVRADSAPRSYMIEPMITTPAGPRELTVGVLDGRALPIIEITPASGLYDYEAKYTRNDTVYALDPHLPPGVAQILSQQAEALFHRIGARHVARADFMLDASGTPWLLEINTIPGFTDHSLVPKAAAHAGIGMPQLCARLVRMALRDHA